MIRKQKALSLYYCTITFLGPVDVNILAKCIILLYQIHIKNDGTCNNDPVDFYTLTCPMVFDAVEPELCQSSSLMGIYYLVVAAVVVMFYLHNSIVVPGAGL